jgi:Domain of unknown function (DUF4157)
MGAHFAEQQHRRKDEDEELQPLRRRLRRESLVVQGKLEVGSAHDPLERDADAAADQIMRQLRTYGDAIVPASAGVSATRIRRLAGAGSAADGFVAPASVEAAISSERGGGSPIEPRVRARFERAMGTDLSEVRVHTNSTADALNRQVSAKAFTTGNDVFFSRGTYDPSSESGQRLLAHELTHTMQQSGMAQRAPIQRMSVQN